MGHLKYNKDTPKKAQAWISTHGLIDYGGATLGQYCAYMDIDDQTHYNWQRAHSEYSEAVIKGRSAYKAKLKEEAVSSLRDLVTGYKVEEKTTEYVEDENGKPTIKHQIIKERHIQKNTAAVIFALTNLDPDHWQNKQNNETKLNAEGIQVVFNQSAGAEARTTEDE